MRKLLALVLVLPALVLTVLALGGPLPGQEQPPSPIRFELKKLPFHLENDASPAKNPPETMAGGVAVFDYNGDGRPDIFFTNGADLATMKKSSPKYSNRLFRNDGNGVFTDVTAEAGLAGSGFDIGVAVGDYDNDGFPDLFVTGVHGNTLYHNNGDGTFTDVTKKAGLDKWNDPEYGPLWAEAAVWVDVNNDGLLDLFIVNYLQWRRGLLPPPLLQGASQPALSQSGRRHLQGCFQGVGYSGPRGQGDGRGHGGLRPGRQAGPVCDQRCRISLPFP
jgi:hypothetical protein